MKYDYYDDAKIADDLSSFEFVSAGKRGRIKKRIEFVKTELSDVYNLSLLNVLTDGSTDDMNVSDNGDRNKILATIFRAVLLYSLTYPQRWIYFCGNTPGKMRLYRMAVSLNWDELSARFEILGETMDEAEVSAFYKGMPVEGFFIRRKMRAMGRF